MSGAYRGRAAGSSVRVEREEVAQLLQRRVDAPVMDEDTARFFPKMAVRQRIVDEHVAGHAVGALVDGHTGNDAGSGERSEEHTSELQSLMRNSYAVFCWKKKKDPSATYTKQI